MKRPVLFTLGGLLLAPIACAQEAKVMYEQLCGACHGNDGKGANAGQFPPLADSAWVKGAPDRMIQVVLHGLMGEITVPSEHAASPTYNLVMPPQGEALTDDQIAKISTYVRSSWGNKEQPVTVAMVKEQREATKGRAPFWQAKEILAKYPLDVKLVPSKEKPLEVDVPIKDLLSYVYNGDWSSLPDFKKLKPAAVEEEHKGLISVKQAGKSENFGMVWEGRITAPKSGSFNFRLASDDGSRLIVGGKTIIDMPSIQSMTGKEGSINLAQGEHPIRIEYFERSGEEDISLAMKGPGLKGWFMLSEGGLKGSGGAANNSSGLPIYPLANEAVIYRNFIQGTTARGIGVGYHGGVNLAFSADNMSVDLLWTGLFMDGKRHWTGRGQGYQPPAGQRVLKVNNGPAFALLDSQTSGWPANYPESLPARFHGYKFNARQEPTFYYTIGEVQVEDTPQPLIGGNKFGLQRALTLTTEKAVNNLYFRAVSGLDVKDAGGGRFEVGGSALIEVGKGVAQAPVLRNNEMLIPLQLKRGENVLTLRYTWK